MDTTTANVFEKLTEGKVDRTKRINDNVDIEKRSINEEQEKVVKDLEEVLSFLKGVQIKNEETLVNIRKPLDDLRTSLKYLPIESSFDSLPSEIKTHILSYLCDTGAFIVASVCHEWKAIVKRRFTERQDEEKDVKVGKHCSNYPQCEDDSCFMPAEILMASTTHKLDIPLTICHSIVEIDSKVIADGLLSVSNFTITGDCKCQFEDDDQCDCVDYDDNEKQILSKDQIEDIIEGLDERVEPLEKVELIQVDMTCVNQDKLVNCLFSKVKWLTLDEGPDDFDVLLDFGIFVDNLKQMTSKVKLKHLTLHNFGFMDEWVDDKLEDLADALCKVETVELSRTFILESETLERLIDNILLRPVTIKCLLIFERMDFCPLISPEELRTLINKMERLQLWGFFTPEQLQVAKTLHDVRVLGKPPRVTLKKGC